MQPAKEELEKAIQVTTFSAPLCPVYQNVDGLPHTDPSEIKANLIECGPGKALQGMIGRIDKTVAAHGIA